LLGWLRVIATNGQRAAAHKKEADQEKLDRLPQHGLGPGRFPAVRLDRLGYENDGPIVLGLTAVNRRSLGEDVIAAIVSSLEYDAGL